MVLKSNPTIENLLMNDKIRDNATFILEAGWSKDIRSCANAGASVLIPNLGMNANLLTMTFVRESKYLIATTLELWECLKSSLIQNPDLMKNLKVILFQNEETLCSECLNRISIA